ncbi:hypothetical protein OKA05_24505 [Luteolibacter arcticus]|uniref:Uncharacterized protein n=1 Tax=Luteolibacter arcticus TaxID=1581411 RepID=A0ABT3GQF5_9BACT|nr:hypothetical protein [Luteolibacter arcticus]MCW1925742.1 hypothetical protein [Luteolibacter arcticus]
MSMKLATFACLSALAVVPLGLAGCNKSFLRTSTTVSSSSRTDLTVNGRRKITKKANDLTRKLETTSDVVMTTGKVTSFPKGAVIKLEETGSPKPRVAEMRENGGSLELWVSESGAFRRGSAEEETWREEFLKDVIDP